MPRDASLSDSYKTGVFRTFRTFFLSRPTRSRLRTVQKKVWPCRTSLPLHKPLINRSTLFSPSSVAKLAHYIWKSLQNTCFFFCTASPCLVLRGHSLQIQGTIDWVPWLPSCCKWRHSYIMKSIWREIRAIHPPLQNIEASCPLIISPDLFRRIFQSTKYE